MTPDSPFVTHHLPLLIAIDGPAASGKGSLGRKVAAHLGVSHLDTGKLYRSVALMVLRGSGTGFCTYENSHKDREVAVKYAQQLDISMMADPDITGEEVGKVASIISAIPEVRQALLQFQRDVAASPKGAVLDGRDIGTVVCPHADFKFFITASLEARATRRFKELHSLGKAVIYDAILEDLARRDAMDSKRAISPLQPAADAIIIDTTEMNAEAVFQKVISVTKSS